MKDDEAVIEASEKSRFFRVAIDYRRYYRSRLGIEVKTKFPGRSLDLMMSLVHLTVRLMVHPVRRVIRGDRV